jgi:hypothetical protein
MTCGLKDTASRKLVVVEPDVSPLVVVFEGRGMS